jgi:hypothetical protein
MSNKIRFSHNYYKLPLAMPFKAVLMQCVKIEESEISNCFRDYDTRFKDGSYPLPEGENILLIFRTVYMQFDGYLLFTTIRRYTPQKWDYYKSKEGEEFEVVKT